jgi:hypothetical protein
MPIDPASTTNWLYSVNGGLLLLATLLSPVVAVLVSIWIQNRKERRAQKLWVLSTLIGNRGDQLSADNVRALNMIDLVFSNQKRVRDLWREYYDMLANEGLNNPVGWKQRSQKNIELLTEMAKSLGYGKEISHLDVERTYFPLKFEREFETNREMQQEFLRVLRSTARFEVHPKEQD